MVVGGVFATQSLEVKNSILGTFNTPSIKASEVIWLLLPSAFSIEPISIIPGTKLYNLALADLGSLYKSIPPALNSGKIEMNLETDVIKTTLTNDQIQKTIRSYSVVGKVLAADLLDYDKFQNHFLLTSASLGSQLLKIYDLGLDSNGNLATLSVDNIRNFFFDILYGRILVPQITGSFDISEILRKFD